MSPFAQHGDHHAVACGDEHFAVSHNIHLIANHVLSNDDIRGHVDGSPNRQR